MLEPLTACHIVCQNIFPMEASVRLQNELKNFQRTRGYGFYARPDPRNILEWKCQFLHKGYFFTLAMSFSQSYPVVPPKIKFDNSIYHPNVFPDNSVCLDIISSKWSPALTIRDILMGLKQLFDFPNPSSPANNGAASLYTKNISKYYKKVEECSAKYHSKYKVPMFE